MQTEVEAKFSATTAAPLEALAVRAALGRATLGPAREVEETDRYLDTDDGRLAAARWAARLRSRDGSTLISLKGPASGPAGGGWPHRRPEVEGPAAHAVAPEAWPPSRARELLVELAAGQQLRERLRLDQRRTERRVTLADGTSIGTLTLDRARISADGRDLGELFVVELELDAGSERGEAELASLAAELAAVPGLRPEPTTKLEHALARLNATR